MNIDLKEPGLEDLNNDRKKGLRPGVVCCCVHNKRLLLLHKKEFGIWLVPQGGINNKEKPTDAVKRKIAEELGENLFRECGETLIYFGKGELPYSERRKGSEEMETDEGVKTPIVGKKYYFYYVPIKTSDVNIKETQFDEYFWLDYGPAKYLLGKNYQVNKRVITLGALDRLKENGLIF